MTDLSHTIAPKSDQLNADDLIAGPMTIKITKVSARPSTAEQPIAINFEGDNDKPYLPCKSMRRVMVAIWGSDGNSYAGRSLTLYRDDHVKFGGMEVGGIRISHMSHIDRDITMALTATRANRKPFTVKPLTVNIDGDKPVRDVSPVDAYSKEVGANIKSMTADQLAIWWAETSQRRLDLEIPSDRLAKMEKAVQKAIGG